MKYAIHLIVGGASLAMLYGLVVALADVLHTVAAALGGAA